MHGFLDFFTAYDTGASTELWDGIRNAERQVYERTILGPLA